jgi:hypothetical protein
MIQSRARGERQHPSPEGVQRSDVCHPHHNYTIAGGDHDVSHRTNEATVDHYTNTPPRATGS